MQLVVNPHGTVRCIYDEAIELAAIGTWAIRRASHVEPTADDRWTADLSIVGGPKLGPFAIRSAALSTERIWLDQHWFDRG